MPRRPQRLSEQHDGKLRAEIARGSGWWPHQRDPCLLEPMWEPYNPKSLSLWDCVYNDWEAPYKAPSLFGGNSGPVIHPADAPLQLPTDPYAIYEYDNRVTIQVALYADDETTMPQADQLLRSLGALKQPLAFELVASGGEAQYDNALLQEICTALIHGDRSRSRSEAITGYAEPYISTQFSAATQDAPLLQQQLGTHYPQSAVQPVEDQLYGLIDIQDERSWAATLCLELPYCFPLRTFRHLEPDPLAVPISVMETLARDQWAMLQILLTPARANWASNIHEATTNPYQGGQSHFDNQTQRLVQDKLSSPLFAVSIRLLASQRETFNQLLAWLQQFTSEHSQRLSVRDEEHVDRQLTEEERNFLEHSVKYRLTYRPGLLLNTEELAGLVHLPLPTIPSQRLARVEIRTQAAPDTKAERGTVQLGDNVHRGQTTPARISAELRPRHCYIAGASGTGKSTLMMNMALQDINRGEGVGIFDPHGDLVEAIAARIPEHRRQDVIYFNPADREFPVGLNIINATGPDERERIVGETIAAMRQFFPDSSWGPRMDHILGYALATAVRLRGGTIWELRRLLTDDAFRIFVVGQLKNPDLLSFWNNEWPKMASNAVDPIINKLTPFIRNSTVCNIVCQRQTRLDFDQILNSGKILLANLSYGLLGHDVAGVLGMFLTNKILGATFRRAAIPPAQRRPWYLYVDEFQNFMHLSHGFDQILSEARKFNLVLAGMANQYVKQLPPGVRAAIFGNVGTLITFRLGVEDARTLAVEFGEFTPEEILAQERGQALVRVGGSRNTFNLVTYPDPPPLEPDPTSDLIAHTRANFATPRDQVEAALRPKEKAKPAAVPVSPPRTAPPPQPKSDGNGSKPKTPPPGGLEDFVS